MECERFRNLIGPYLRREVGGVLVNEFRWHKHFCETCAAAFARRISKPDRQPEAARDNPPSSMRAGFADGGPVRSGASGNEAPGAPERAGRTRRMRRET